MSEEEQETLQVERLASSMFVSSILEQTDLEMMGQIIEAQKDGLNKFEKANEMLVNCTKLSQTRLDGVRTELTWYINTMSLMKKDLDSIFRRIKLFRQTLSQLYPEEFAAAVIAHKPERSISMETDELSEPATNSS